MVRLTHSPGDISAAPLLVTGTPFSNAFREKNMQRVNMRAIAAAKVNRLVRFASFPPMAGLPSVSPAPLDIATEDPTIAEKVDVLEEVRRCLDGVWVVSGVCTTRIISDCGIVVNCQLVFDSKRPVVLTGAGVSTGAADSTSLLLVHCVQALQWVHILLL